MRLIFVVIFLGLSHEILCENLWEEIDIWLSNMFYGSEGDRHNHKHPADSNSPMSHKKKKDGLCEFIKDIFGIEDDGNDSGDSSTEGQPSWMQGLQNPPRPQYWPVNMPPNSGQQLPPGAIGPPNYYGPGGPPPSPYQYQPPTSYGPGFYQQIPSYYNPPMAIPNNFPGAPPPISSYPSAVAPVAATATAVAATAAPVAATVAPVAATAAPVAASNATNTTSATNGTSTLILSTASDTKNDTDARRR